MSNAMTDCYTEYSNFVADIVATKDLSEFKNHPSYTYMLEHVTETAGHEYIYNIVTRFSSSQADILEFCSMNDRYGNPVRYNYLGTQTSSSSLRYFLHAMLILTYFQSKAKNEDGRVNPIRIVELGGGYGGLCLAIDYCLKYFPDLKIVEYNIIDLTNPSKLQALYLSHYSLSYPCNFLDARNFGADVKEGEEPLFLISNYCFSEIAKPLQDTYQAILFPKVKHGFLTWNTPLRGFGKALSIEPEYPRTGPLNFYVRF